MMGKCWSVSFALCLVLGLTALGCGSGSDGSSSGVMVGVDVSPPPSWVYTPAPTATSWPTFTPVPTTLTPTPVPTPALTLGPTLTPWPTLTSTPAPTVVPTEVPTSVPDVSELSPPVLGSPTPGVVNTPEPTVDLTPSPTPYGKIWNDDFFFWQQSFFPLQSSEVPQYLNDNEWEKLPPPVDFVSRFSRFVIWVVVFDGSRADPDFVMNGFVRWIEMPPGDESLIMLESPVELSVPAPFFYTGLGRASPGFWRVGNYRIELLDDRYEPVVGWNFEVK